MPPDGIEGGSSAHHTPEPDRTARAPAGPAPAAVYFDWTLDARAGGPPGYLANLRDGLVDIGAEDRVAIVARTPAPGTGPGGVPRIRTDEPLFGARSRRAADAAGAKHGPADAAALREAAFVARPDWLHVRPEQFLRLDPQARRIVHAHTTIDAVKLHNSLTRHGLRHRVKLVLTSHCPEAPAKEWSEKLAAEGAAPESAELLFHNYRHLDHLAFHHADVLVFPCAEALEPYRATMEDFDRLFGQRDIRFVPTGAASLPPPAENRAALRARHGLGDGFVACYIGRHNRAKGYDTLMEVGAALLPERPELAFLVGGREGPLPAPAHPRWIEAGWTDRPGDLLGAADVFVLPNRQTYFDLMLLEVLSAGRMVVASATGGNRHFTGLSEGILLYRTRGELAEALSFVAGLDPAERARRGAANRALYEARFTPAHFARAYIRVLDGIVADYRLEGTAGTHSALRPGPVARLMPQRAAPPRTAVSVIVPVWNAEARLEACLASIAAQTLREIEVLVVNDGSTDGSAAIIEAFAARDPRFSRIDRPNGGLSAARNTGLDAARGHYVAFADADDMLAPEMLERLHAACERTGLPLAVCGVRHVDEGGAETAVASSFIEDELVFPHWHDGSIACLPEVVTSLYPSAWNKLYRRELFNDLRYDRGLYYEDHPVFYRLFLKAERFAYVNQPLYEHRQSGPARITRDGSRRALDVFTVLDMVESQLRARGERALTRRLMARLVMRLVWERLWAVSDQRTRFRLAELAVMRFAAHGLSRDEVCAARDPAIPEADVDALFELAEAGGWTAPEKAVLPFGARVRCRDATPDPIPREYPMVRYDTDENFILVHPQEGRVTTAEITGLGFFGPGELRMALSVENAKAPETGFRVMVAPHRVLDPACFEEEDNPVWLAVSDWTWIAPLAQREIALSIPEGAPTLAIYVRTALRPGASMHHAWARLRAIDILPGTARHGRVA